MKIHPDSKVLLGESLREHYHGARFIDAQTFQKNHPALQLGETFVIGCYNHSVRHGEIPCTYQAKQFAGPNGRGSWTAEASDLGWPPGMWPKRFKVNGLGNGQDFILMTEHEGTRIYNQEFGCVTVEVWND